MPLKVQEMESLFGFQNTGTLPVTTDITKDATETIILEVPIIILMDPSDPLRITPIEEEYVASMKGIRKANNSQDLENTWKIAEKETSITKYVCLLQI